MPVALTCETCGAPFSRPRSLVKKRHFCSRPCYRARESVAQGNYLFRKVPSHPLAGASGVQPVHRLVLFEKIGPGTHPCHWCGIKVEWLPGRLQSGVPTLVVDHVDGQTRNNGPDNLVPSCQPCNASRTQHRVRDDEVFVTVRNGARIRGEERICVTCETAFVAIPDRRPNRGRFCSMSCARRALR